MNIQRATKKALRTGGSIARRECLLIQIKPTNGEGGCIIFNFKDILPSRWRPSANDLMADDWYVLERWNEWFKQKKIHLIPGG